VKKIAGYIHDAETGAVLTGKPVSVLSEVTDVLIPNDAYTGPVNPVTTDALTGYFEWTCELSPGPLKLVADLGGGKAKVRSGDEVMQAAMGFVSDGPAYAGAFYDGVLPLVGNAFHATTSGMQLTLQPGAALLKGLLWQTISNRVVTIAANPTFTERWDLLVLQQHVGGTYIGKQALAVVSGVASKDDPSYNTDPNIFEFPLYRVKVALNAGVLTIDDLRKYTYAPPGPNSIDPGMLTAGGAVSNASSARLLTAPSDTPAGQLTPSYTTLTLGELEDVSMATPAGPGLPLLWDGAFWRPTGQLTLTGAVPTASNHAALGGSGQTITFPWGNDTVFEVRFHTGSGASAGDWANIIFATNRTNATYGVLFSPLNSLACDLALYATGKTTDHFTVNARGAVSSGADYWYNAVVLGDV
jgi:hypothetical protein